MTSTSSAGPGIREGRSYHLGLALVFIPPDNGSYTVNLDVTDDDTGTDTDSVTIDVTNVAPTFDAVQVTPSSIMEGEEVVLDVDFFDPGYGDVLTLTVDWGDGTVDSPRVYSGRGHAVTGIAHVYADDPAGTPDEYTVTLTLEDDDGGLTSTTRTVTVANRTPAFVAPGVDFPVPLGDTFYLAGYVDDNPADVVEVEVDFGDGSPVETYPGLTPGSAVYFDHVYATEGDFTVTVTSTDDDGAQAIDTFLADVDDATGTLIRELAIEALTPTVREGDLGQFIIRRFGPSGESAVVYGETTNGPGNADYEFLGTATPDADYTSPGVLVDLVIGDVPLLIDIPTIDDTEEEDPETIEMQLTAAWADGESAACCGCAPAYLLLTSLGSMTETDNDGSSEETDGQLPVVKFDNARRVGVSEPEADPNDPQDHIVALSLTRTGRMDTAITVTLVPQHFYGADSDDYNVPLSVNFEALPAGSPPQTKTINFVAEEDALWEESEVVRLIIPDPGGPNGGAYDRDPQNAYTEVTIFDDPTDWNLDVNPNPVRVSERDGAAVFTVSANNLTETVKIYVKTEDGSARDAPDPASGDPADYDPIDGYVELSPSQSEGTISVQVRPDSKAGEGIEDFSVVFWHQQPGDLVSATGEIVDVSLEIQPQSGDPADPRVDLFINDEKNDDADPERDLESTREEVLVFFGHPDLGNVSHLQFSCSDPDLVTITEVSADPLPPNSSGKRFELVGLREGTGTLTATMTLQYGNQSYALQEEIPVAVRMADLVSIVDRAVEREPGILIRSNNDDNDGDGVVDYLDNDDGVAGEDDLKRISFADGGAIAAGATCELEYTEGSLAVWKDPEKREKVRPRQGNNAGDPLESGEYWVEGISPGQHDLRLRVTKGGETITDVITFTVVGVDVLQVPQYLFASATYSTPIRFKLEDAAALTVHQVDVGMFIGDTPVIAYSNRDRFGAGDGFQEDRGNGTTNEYTVFVPPTELRKVNLAADKTQNARFTVRATVSIAAAPGGPYSPSLRTHYSFLADPQAKPDSFADRDVFALDMASGTTGEDRHIDLTAAIQQTNLNSQATKYWKTYDGTQHVSYVPPRPRTRADLINWGGWEEVTSTPTNLPNGLGVKTRLMDEGAGDPPFARGDTYKTMTVATRGGYFFASYGGRAIPWLQGQRDNIGMDTEKIQNGLNLQWMKAGEAGATVVITGDPPNAVDLQGALSVATGLGWALAGTTGNPIGVLIGGASGVANVLLSQMDGRTPSSANESGGNIHGVFAKTRPTGTIFNEFATQVITNETPHTFGFSYEEHVNAGDQVAFYLSVSSWTVATDVNFAVGQHAQGAMARVTARSAEDWDEVDVGFSPVTP